jgi:hypothetical protein
MPKILCEKTQCGTSLKTALRFSKVFSKKPNFAKYENLLHFFQCSFNQTRLSKMWKSFTFFQRFFQGNPILTKHENHFFWGGFFKDLWSIFVFLSEVLEFKVSYFLQWKKWDHWTFNTQFHNFFLTLWMWPWNGISCHFFYIFIHLLKFIQVWWWWVH